MKFILTATFLFLISTTFTSCCIPKFIGLDQAKEIGFYAIERFCETHRATKPIDYKLTSTEQNVAIGNSWKRHAWVMTYISYQKNGETFVEVIIMIDHCGGTETSFWDYTERK